jgi:hypothetical protein
VQRHVELTDGPERTRQPSNAFSRAPDRARGKRRRHHGDGFTQPPRGDAGLVDRVHVPLERCREVLCKRMASPGQQSLENMRSRHARMNAPDESERQS